MKVTRGSSTSRIIFCVEIQSKFAFQAFYLDKPRELRIASRQQKILVVKGEFCMANPNCRPVAVSVIFFLLSVLSGFVPPLGAASVEDIALLNRADRQKV